MKEILAVLSLVVATVVCEPPAAPYPPSGWRPNGPAFELPQQEASQSSEQSYLPPRVQNQYGAPNEADLAVQGLPVKEQTPIFLVSPINGQQYVGVNFNGDIRNLDERLKESQAQQEVFRQIARERQQYGPPSTRLDPRQLGKDSTNYPTVTESTTFETTPNEFENREPVTEINDNNDQSLRTPNQVGNQNQQSQNVLAVEITKENLKELPVILLGSLNQYNSQLYPKQDKGALFLPQTGIQSAKFSQSQVGFNGPTHLSGLQSILSQRQLLAAQQPQRFTPNQEVGVQNQVYLSQRQLLAAQPPQRFIPNQEVGVQNPPTFLANNNQAMAAISKDVEQFSESEQTFNQFTPMVQQQPKAAFFPQVQPVLLQNQPQYLFSSAQVQLPNNQYGQPLNNQAGSTDDNEDANNKRNDPNQSQFVLNPQQTYQPQQVQFPVNGQVYQTQSVQNQQAFLTQPQVMYQPQDYQQNQLLLNQPQYLNYQPVLNQDLSQYYQNQAFIQQQQVQQQVYQNGLQEGLDKNEQGNGLEQDKEDDDDSNEATDPSVSAVATAFGARTSPRVYTQYGLPANRPSTSEQETVTEAIDSSTEEPEPAVAQATAVARGSNRRNSKLRVRRLRPVFTLDKSGHLVLLNNQ